MNTEGLTRRFEKEFGRKPKVFTAPGRVNLIGEHTDYNDGFVLPCAIGFRTRVAIGAREDRKLVLLSEDFPDRFEFDSFRLWIPLSSHKGLVERVRSRQKSPSLRLAPLECAHPHRTPSGYA